MSDKKMIEPIQVRIVKAIIRDLDSSMGFSEALLSVHPKSQIVMFETWMQLTAEELLKDGLIDKPLSILLRRRMRRLGVYLQAGWQ
jgi:hypothetical protein